MTKFYLSLSRYVAVFVFAMLTTVAWSQSKTVTGKVTSSDDGSSLPGVNVLEKGTSNGTVTDADGKYSINVSSDAVLVFSFVGFNSQEAVVGAQTSVNIVLQSDITSLSEVVVVGYGTQEKKEITSAVSSVKSEDFNKGTVNDPSQLLQGKVAGLTVTRAGGDPNDPFTLRLRGVSTVGANSAPLIVIDGVIGGSLNTVDPNDIESMDILKDGSAAAIYGSRGSNGVILVTTKSGKSGKMVVDYNGSIAFENIANTVDFMDAGEYRAVPGARDLGTSTDWLDVVTQQGRTMVHNLAFSGGTKQTTYRASFNLRDAQGIALNSGFNQINMRLNISQKALNDRLTFKLDAAMTTKEAEYGFKESLRYAVIANPTMPVYDATLTSPTAGGRYGGYAERDIFDFFNPLSITEQNINEGKDGRILARMSAEYDFNDIIQGLRFGMNYSLQRENDLRGEYYAKTAKFRGAGRNGLASRRTDQRNNDLFELTLNYDKNLGGADLAILGGYSYQEFFNEGFNMEGGNFVTDAFTYNNMSAALDFANGLGSVDSYANSSKLIAFFGRANLNIKENYFLSASARYEGSSKFGENNKWGLFPAVSAGVTISNLVDLPVLNSLKFRASWGVTGNNPADSYISKLRFGENGNFLYEGNWVPAYGPVANANPDLKWETKDEIDFGLDFALLDNRLTGSMDYYMRNTKDMILQVNVPQPPNLAQQTWVNVGELSNKGFELALNYAAIQKPEFTWSTGINFATFKTVVESLTSEDGNFSVGEGGVLYRANMGAPGQNDYLLARVKQGEELGQLWGPVQIGVNPDGTPKFADLDGDGSYCNCNNDKQVNGNGLPDFTLGFNNTFTYKRFDMSIFFRGAFGHDLVNSYRGFYENLETTTVNNYNPVNTEFFDPTITKAVVNSSHVENASFFRLDNMSIGYNVPLPSGGAISRLRFSLAGQNLFTITDYTGVDPEVRYQDQNDSDNGGRPGAVDPLAPGIERRSTYFTTRTFTFSVNLGF